MAGRERACLIRATASSNSSWGITGVRSPRSTESRRVIQDLQPPYSGEIGDGLTFAHAINAQDEEPEGLAGLPSETLLGVVVGPDVEGGDAFEGGFFRDLHGIVEPGPVGEGYGLGLYAVGQKSDVVLEGGLEEILLLVLVGGKEEEGWMGRNEVFAVLADAAFA